MYRQLKTFTRVSRISCQTYSTVSTKPNVWVVTDGGIESTLQAMTLGKQLAGSDQHFKLKTFHSSKTLQLFPAILQKYLVDWSSSKSTSENLPWFLSSKDQPIEDTKPDYIITSGKEAIPACLHYSKLNEKSFSVYVGYPSLPFINFDQVILPKYEANAKMAALGPLARQKNGIITPAPLVDTPSSDSVGLHSTIPFNKGFTTVVVGGHSSVCRWYSEDAVTLVDNIKRMVHQLNDKVVVVYTDRTPPLVKEKMTQKILDTIDTKSVFIWDSATLNEDTAEKIHVYESMIHHSQRVVLTADLDYACSHALSKSKPVYIAFGGRCRSYLQQFHRWVLDAHLTRKLRLDKNKHTVSKAEDPYSYLGHHALWNNVSKIFQIKHTMSFVKNELQVSREEKVTGKRRK